MDVNVLITGGAGYLGSTLVPSLLNKGYKVTVLDNFMFQQNSLMECCSNHNFKVESGDARDRSIMKRLIKDHDYIIPLAALVGAPLCNRDAIGTKTTNLDATKLVVDLMSKNQRMLVPITNSGYGIGEKGIYCTEETPLRPISTYGQYKVEAESYALENANCISFRLATVFGMSPRMRIDLLVNDFTHRAVKDRFIIVFEGLFKRNYIHVRDVARVFLHGMKNFESMKNQPYNVGLSDANISKLELCAKIKEHLPEFTYMEAPIGEDPDKRDYIVSNEKIERTGFKQKYSLDMGIQELIKGFTILNNSKYTNV